MIGTIDISKIMIGTGETGRGRVIPDHERGIEEERERKETGKRNIRKRGDRVLLLHQVKAKSPDLLLNHLNLLVLNLNLKVKMID